MASSDGKANRFHFSTFDANNPQTMLSAFHQHNQTYFDFMSNLVKQVKTLTETNTRLDVENRNLLRELQEREENKKIVDYELLTIKMELSKEAFVAVLIDGDGMLFSKEHLAQGFEGGRSAVRELITWTRNGLDSKTVATAKIWIMVFANATMLAPVLLQHNIVPKVESFNEFINGFSSVDGLVTFTNVGRGKELTDTKIKALISMFASWPQCVKIILGGSHDNGYSRILSKLVTDNIVPGKVALLQGPPFAMELAHQSTSIFPRLQFGDLFMTTKLESTMEKSTSYVQVASNGALQLPRKASSPTIPATVVPYKAGLPEKAVYLSLKQLKPAPCNNYYLNPQGCYKAESECKYSHSHKLSDDQLSALRYYCKVNPCDAWQRNRNCLFGNDCIRGHDCPDNVGGRCSRGAECKLSHPERGSYI